MTTCELIFFVFLSSTDDTTKATLSNGVITANASPAATTSAASSTASTTPANTGLGAGYASAASSIVAEGTNGRALTGASYSDASMTPQVCATYCTGQGFGLSGTEYASQW